MVTIKNKQEQQLMREAGKILSEILRELARHTKIGVTTGDLNIKAEALMAQYNVAPSFKGYHGFPAVICISVNEEVVHGIPGRRIINDGDIVTIDCGIIYNGWHSDAAVAILVGNVDPMVEKFVEVVQKTFEKILPVIKPGNHVGDIGFTTQQWIESNGYSVVRDFVGHGIGRSMHEEPQIPNFGQKGKGQLLVPGMTIAIEPIINMGGRYIDVLEDDWTAVTRDGSMSCQIEHTFLVTETGNEVLTKYNGTINSIIRNRN